jgi:hypothetical protein
MLTVVSVWALLGIYTVVATDEVSDYSKESECGFDTAHDRVHLVPPIVNHPHHANTAPLTPPLFSLTYHAFSTML